MSGICLDVRNFLGVRNFWVWLERVPRVRVRVENDLKVDDFPKIRPQG